MYNSSELIKPLSVFSEYVDFSQIKNVFPLEAEGYYDAKFFFLREGSVNVRLEENEFSMRAGNLMLVCPGTPFSLQPAEAEKPAQLLMIRLDPAQLITPPCSVGWHTVFREAKQQNMPMCISAEQADQWHVSQIVDVCLEEYQQRAFGWETMTFTGMNQLCVFLLRFWRAQGLKLPLRAVEEDPVSEITAFIQQHIQDGIRVEELAARCNLSYPWFAKRFREMFGISCKEYIERVRIARVEQYLYCTDLDLAEISEITGYADCSHMIKNFKRLKNMTPGRFRSGQKD